MVMGLACAGIGIVTLLCCTVPCQAALFGILGKVRDLGTPLLSVYRVGYGGTA
jgi:hypothetical protein